MIHIRFTAIIVLLLGSLAGCGMLDKKAVEVMEEAGQELGLNIEVEDVRIRIFGGSGQVTGVYVGNPEGYVAENAFEMQLIGLDLKLLSVLSKPFTLNELVVDSPIVNLELKDPDGSNFKDIADKVSARLNESSDEEVDEEPAEEAEADEEKPGKEAARIAIGTLRIQGVTFNLRRADGSMESGTLPTIELQDVGGEDGATMAGIMATIAIALAGEILEQEVEKRIASGELDPEALVGELERRFAEIEGEIPDEVRQPLEETIAELRGIIDASEQDGYADLESVAAELAAVSAALVTRLAETLSDEQMARLREFLDKIDRDAVAALRDELIERFRQRLLLSQEQLEVLKPLLENSLARLSQLREGLGEGGVDLEEYQRRYAEIRDDIAARLREVLDDSQYESFQQWAGQADQRIREKYFSN
jgi:hypothetical protein